MGSHRLSSIRTSLSHQTIETLSGFPSSMGPAGLAGAPSMRSEITPAGSGSTAPDAEIRQLVHSQRRRANAQKGAGSGAGHELDGVVLDSVLGQGSFGVVGGEHG